MEKLLFFVLGSILIPNYDAFERVNVSESLTTPPQMMPTSSFLVGSSSSNSSEMCQVLCARTFSLS